MLSAHRLPMALLCALASAALVAGTLTATSASAAPTAAAANPVTPGSSEVAEEALAQVQAALEPAEAGPSARSAEGATRGDLTMAMRDLQVNRSKLSAADQAAAARVLARPSAGQHRDFGGRVRIHWVKPSNPQKAKKRSAFVNKVGGVVTHVLKVYRKAGYRAPKSDGSRGGGRGLLDIYLQDLGNQGLYGYCSSDSAPSRAPWDAPAYCAFDDDFSEFPALSPVENLKVTAAHELFHAVQFSYDYLEDAWFMEATAAWAEDEVYDSINDNRQYLRSSPLAYPTRSFDNNNGIGVYGTWIFFRYLTERFPKSQAGMPLLMRSMWRYADSVKGKDYYSIQAVTKALGDHKLPLRKALAQFADANRRPRAAYREGSHYRTAPLSGSWKLTSKKKSTGWQQAKLDHLASATVQIRPGSGLRKGWKLQVSLDLPDLSQAPGAVVTVYRSSGSRSSSYLALNRKGNKTVKTPFGRSVSRVEVTMVNAGTSYRCWQQSGSFSCHGKSKDNGRTIKIRARAVR